MDGCGCRGRDVDVEGGREGGEGCGCRGRGGRDGLDGCR